MPAPSVETGGISPNMAIDVIGDVIADNPIGALASIPAFCM
jgi:hypothetical protein